MKLPNYPIEFHECSRNKRITEEELNTKINNEIERIIKFMVDNQTENHSVSFEDVLIIVDRVDEEEEYYYEVSVAKEHSRVRVNV
ncbi:hypothetical protein [Halalkalibacter nanhaiisediminis]|uniref:Uncharacterized protein n=1 Tax=Halalkalibacter nanhaiisediminis TaxID=688079 RepID=A0A562QR94_9BACI|nr:hypothetical protein [Halalkalibacter nanhaiisediminis]TWI59227.1 hypothetical protein IQ10_00941 [Halalkalibacter nanhaiisediminis]